MEQRKELELSQERSHWKNLRRGWCWGPKVFREALLELIGANQDQQNHGEELRESDVKKKKYRAEQFISQLP